MVWLVGLVGGALLVFYFGCFGRVYFGGWSLVGFLLWLLWLLWLPCCGSLGSRTLVALVTLVVFYFGRSQFTIMGYYETVLLWLLWLNCHPQNFCDWYSTQYLYFSTLVTLVDNSRQMPPWSGRTSRELPRAT